MSKFKKLFLSALAVCALSIGVGINPVTAYAEDSAETPEISAEIETSEEVVEDSESVENSEDIGVKEENSVEDTNEVVLPVICGIAGIVGCALIALIVGKNWSKIKGSFDAIIEWFKNKKEAITNEELDLAEIKSRISDYIKSNEELKALLDRAYKKNAEEFEKFAALIKETVRTVLGEYEKIKKALLLITQGEAELVQRGVADEVLKLLGVPAEEKKE